MAAPRSRQIELNSLSTQQLSSVKKQLDDELEHLTSSFTKLRSAQAKFRECLSAITDGVSPNRRGNSILVPLTASLYVPGELLNPGNVLIDIGTGFYVEKSGSDAEKFYNSRIDELAQSLKELETIVQAKSNNLRAVEDVLRIKVIEEAKG